MANFGWRFNMAWSALIPKTEQIKRYLNDPADRYSYSGKITRDVFMDSSGVVWIGTDEGGLNVYDYERDRF